MARDAIATRVAELAGDIDLWCAGRTLPVLLVCVMRGALFFTADLARRLESTVDLEAVTVRSYGAGTTSSGTVQLVDGVVADVSGRDVLLVEDIVDSGRTLAFLVDHLRRRGAREVRAVTLLDKPSRRQVPVQPDWVGFTVPDRFVVGYGLDHGGRFRTLADVHALVTR